MKKTWRWFGKNDPITLSDLKQIGVEGIVTSLYHIPNGEIWSLEEIEDLKNYIENGGLEWSVVESLPVSEEIKYAGPRRDQLIENYKIGLENLGKAGVKVVCYNFMPVIDWIRTDLNRKRSDGTYTLYFDRVKFAYFDIYLLGREGARKDYPEEVLKEVDALNKVITPEEKNGLIDTIIIKTQGFVSGNFKEGDSEPVKLFNQLLERYKGIDKEQLQENFRYFMEAVVPTAEQYGVKLCIHPDDPPFPVLGLPRIVTNEEDINWLLKAVDNPYNGLTFCAGSLSAGIHNDLIKMAEKFADRTHFVHLRSTETLPNGDFVEASHLGGRGHLLELIRIFKKYPDVPMRVDHGPLMLDDVNKKYNPGYSFLGRMKALAEVSGMMHAVDSEKCC
jgi:mannonate dehydratase